ncbi:hypothetical protein Tco_0240885 [Tanacetum coccineum]
MDEVSLSFRSEYVCNKQRGFPSPIISKNTTVPVISRIQKNLLDKKGFRSFPSRSSLPRIFSKLTTHHEGYQNTIELPDRNNVVPLRSDTIRLVQNECSFHGLWSEDPNQHLKDIFKIVDSLDLNVENRERMRLHLFQFFLRDQAINWLEHLSNASDCRLIELENQVQRLMEAHFAPKPSIQVNKIASSCEICSGPHDTHYCMKILSKLLLIMHPRVPKKWEAINDRMTGVLPSDTVKNPKLNVNPTSSVSSTRSYPMEAPQSSSNPFKLVNPIKICFKSTTTFPKDLLRVKTLTVNEIETSESKEPKEALEDEFKDLHLNLPVLEVLAHAPIYNAILDNYVESHELGKNRKVKAFGGILRYRYGKDPTCPLLVGRGFLATTSAVIDCKKAKIAIGEGFTRSIFRVKEINLGVEDVPYWTTIEKQESYTPRPSTDRIGARPPYYAKKDYMDYHLLGEWEIARDAELNPFKDVLVFRKMVEFLRIIPINLKGNMWESEELIEKKIDWNKPPK